MRSAERASSPATARPGVADAVQPVATVALAVLAPRNMTNGDRVQHRGMIGR